MKRPQDINIQEFDYELPDHRIAKFPVEPREKCKLLHFNDREITHHTFEEITQRLDEQDLLVMNNARVINARLKFQKPTGGKVEIFVLEPHEQTPDEALKNVGSTVWKCMVGGAKKWKEGAVKLEEQLAACPHLEATLVQREPHFLVEFSWATNITWGEILDEAGKIPLPPYLNRNSEASDAEDYQTVYAQQPGSVAAPTAGLHFSENLLEKLNRNGVRTAQLTLHVGAGTFKPVSSETLGGHDMHRELVDIDRNTIQAVVDAPSVIAVGTTAMRSLESAYWLG
ncbi:MAG: S-adenosylmethionine:tRNA ribosyltransferase-isomerase, partial [Flavobacteriales bacterium]|nr:S-adenosylmethionine:tRNA ribosyltransferase-isomerase [Flavobacteriales bacterium]